MAKILVVDDEAAILELMLDILRGAGHDVSGVRDGAAALTVLQSEIFDVVLLDVKMPKVDGYQVAAHVKKLSYRPHVAMVTSRTFEQDKVAVGTVGAEVFIQKPFSHQDLLEAVDAMLGKK